MKDSMLLMLYSDGFDEIESMLQLTIFLRGTGRQGFSSYWKVTILVLGTRQMAIFPMASQLL
jgi:hypothetical protein